MNREWLAGLLRRKVSITGDGNVIGTDDTVNVVKQEAGDYAIQIGQVNVTLSLDELRHLLAPAYTPPSPPDPEILPEPGPLPPGSRMPFHRNALFTGRVAPLKALARALLYEQSPNTLVTQSIQGMGGIGKTQLVVEFAYRYGRFFHGVHWLNAVQPDLLGAEIAACGAMMGLPGWPEEQPEQVARTLRTWREGGLRLVILDNLEEVDAARAWLGRLSGGTVRVLLTARRADWPRDLGLTLLPLEVFTLRESRVFLRRYLPDGRATDADLDTLAEQLGNLPLALELAGRYLERRRLMSVSAFLEKVEEVLTHPSMRGWRAELGNPTDHDLDLAATFALSWEQVLEESARRLFLATGYCAPNQPIPYELLRQATGLDKETCDEALDRLTGLGLLEMETLEASPTIHPLLAEYVRTLPAKPGDGDLLPTLARTLTDLTYQANDSGLPVRFVPLRPHTEVVSVYAQAALLKEAGVLWNNLGYHLMMIADYAGAQEAFQRALVIDEEVYGPNHPNVARDINNLGVVLQALGDLEKARNSYQRALAIDKQVYGPGHPNVARDINNLGSALKEMGDFERARRAFQQALTIDEQVYDSDHPNVARDMNNLGGVLQALGDLEGARDSYQRALAINEKVYGSDHPNVARALNNLGLALRALSDLEGAQRAFERALAIDERVYGPDHPIIATVHNNLGLVLQASGNLAGALEAFQRALAIDKQIYGPDHPEVATDVNNLGGILRDLGDLNSAREAFQWALAIDEKIYGPDHPKVAVRLNNLGSMLQAQGNLEEARDAFQRALTIDERAYGPDHPDVARDVNNLGSVLQALGDLERAQDAFQQALAIDEKIYGPDHPNVASEVNSLGEVLEALGDLEGARGAFQQALRILEKSLPPEHLHIRIVQGNLERTTHKE